MDKQRIEYLHDKHLQDTLSPPERKEWENILIDPEAAPILQALAYAQWDNMSSEDRISLKGNRSAEIFEQISSFRQPTIKRFVLWPRIAAAAAIVLVTSAGLFYYSAQKRKAEQGQFVQQDIKPGGNKAYLTLANGKKISLTDAANGTIASQAGVSITKTANGLVVYTAQHTGNTNGEVLYNTFETPKGGQYKIQLPDGSSVWLNAASSLKYPASFASMKSRMVELKGEAYFEISKAKAHPFIVRTGEQDVEVLGTHFNINAYADEPVTRTTLLEGSVKISQDKQSKMIKPGQQAVLSHSGTLSVADIDTELAVAWKNNNFMFENGDIQSIMRMVERWYNVEVIYSGPAPTERFGGAVSRFENVSSVLRILGSTGGAHFKIEGRKIYVSK